MEALPFDPIIGIGDDEVTPDSPAADNHFTFSIAVDSFAAGQIRPFDFGPITLGFEDLDIGATTVGASLTLGRLRGRRVERRLRRQSDTRRHRRVRR